MTLTLKLALQLLALLCFAIVAVGSRAWYGPSATYGWAGNGLLGLGLFFWLASEVFAA